VVLVPLAYLSQCRVERLDVFRGDEY